MKLIDIYYQAKPVIPRILQIAIRRTVARHKRRLYANTWPIDPEASKAPRGWNGWPEKKKFALVLQHDVDSVKGLKRCAQLMNLEKALGFRSSFNFVPEDYPLPTALRHSLDESGFEIGVHGLKHDGKLFKDPVEYCKKVPRINSYLHKWGSVGFTSPSMLRNLSWIGELDIEHACSTFDTDPFEPQSDGVGTIFPFTANNALNTRPYVEIPYTLPQDHGLFIILQEKDIRIWKQKLDWVADNGGMAALNTHPDYMNFGDKPLAREEYPVSLYIEFLDYLKDKYSGKYWPALPREMARFWKKSMAWHDPRYPLLERSELLPQDYLRRERQFPSRPAVKIWIDLDNTPHVPLFIPIIRELERRGHKIVLSARNAFQVCDLARKKGLDFRPIGRHYGKNPIMKVAGLLVRGMQLLPFRLRQKPRLSLSHGSRSQNFISNLTGIPTVLIADYEHATTAPFTHPRWTIVPEVLSPDRLPSAIGRIRYYRGIKEDVYVPDFVPDPALGEELGLRPDELIVTVRPPADEAHYYNPESDVFFHELMDRICRTSGVRVVLLPRNAHQESALKAGYPRWFENGRTVIPGRAVDGLSLLWLSDLVVSGGGTMNREAAALGVPVYSIFRGKTGAVDRMLEEMGRLVMVRTKEEIWSKIAFERRDKTRPPDKRPRPALGDIIDQLESIIRLEYPGPRRKSKDKL